MWENDEHLKLIRVSLDFDPDLDDMFEINTSKMSVTLPPKVVTALKNTHLKAPRKQARDRYDRKDGSKRRPKKARTLPPSTPGSVPSPASPPSGKVDTKGAAPPPQRPSTPPSRGDVGASKERESPGVGSSSEPPRFSSVHGGGARAWLIDQDLLGRKEIRLDLDHPQGRLLSSMCPSRSERSVLSALLIVLDQVPQAEQKVHELWRKWSSMGGPEDD